VGFTWWWPGTLYRNSLQSTRVPCTCRLRWQPDLVCLLCQSSLRFPTSDGFLVRIRFHRETAPSLLWHFHDCVKGALRELYANVLLTASPADKDSLVVIQMCYIGPKAQGLEYLQALSSWTGKCCLLNEVHEKTIQTGMPHPSDTSALSRRDTDVIADPVIPSELRPPFSPGREARGGWLMREDVDASRRSGLRAQCKTASK
jgi:hypothetical protein